MLRVFGIRILFFLIICSCGMDAKVFAQQQANAPKENTLPDVDRIEIQTLIENQLKAMSQKDYSRAYYVYTTPKFRQASTMSAFTTFVKKYADYWPNYKREWDSVKREGNLVDVKLEVSSQKKKLQATFYVILEGNRWKILGLLLSPAPLPDPNLPRPIPQEE